ncbi:hypothetical protein L1049_003636 [Liquidambar formosana]|uniref:Peptidase A1 domain-containing protein n=1 Tax=Liquidambar formosana TaxID=63359 RepID=A0AAP0WZT0_LIQFO
MARTWALLSLCLLSNCFLLQLCDVVAESEGLSIKFIHRYSPDSPFYQANLTCGERLVNLSKLRANYLAADAARSATGSNSSDQTVAHPTAIRSLVGVHQGIYMVQLSIGTFHTLPPSPSYKSFFLVLDTGSYLTWTQCELCKIPGHECFVQEEPIFPNSQSQTHRSLPCGKDRLCYTGQCIGDACSYKRDYASGCSSQGVLATRTFTFVSDNRIDTKRIDGLVFGCGIDNKNFKYEAGNQIAGIMGLGWGDRSLINQPQSLSHGRFSYCLQPLNNPQESSRMFLRIGGDIVQRQGLGITPISSR